MKGEPGKDGVVLGFYRKEVESKLTGSASVRVEAEVFCDSGDVATGGGYDMQFSTTAKVIRSQYVQEQGTPGSGWIAWYEGGPSGNSVWTKVVCADLTP